MYDIGTFRDRADFATVDHDAPVRDTARPDILHRAAHPREAIGMDGIETAAAAIGADAYREAMSRLASAVHLVTTDGPGGRAGFTASAVCSVSDAPPTLLVCINRSSSAYAAVSRNDVLCVSTLGAEHRDLAADFGGRVPAHERFALARWTRLRTGAPVLAGALVAFDCRIVARHPAGSHDVLFCEIQALAALQEADALVYAGRRYHALPHAPREAPAARARPPVAV